MKRIINGLTYNTETSTRVAQSEWLDHDDNSEVTGVLYQTRGGAFFVHHVSRSEVKNRHGEWDVRIRNDITPLTAERAHAWMMDDAEVFTNPFEDPPEAAAEMEAAATLYVRVPTALKRRVDAAADAQGVSANAWAMRCIERCLDQDASRSV